MAVLWIPTLALADDNYEENDTIAASFDLSAKKGRWLSTIDGLGVQFDGDWYKITVGLPVVVGPSDLRVVIDCRFQHADGNVNVQLYEYNALFPLRLASSAGTSDAERIEVNVGVAGTYYIRVSGDNVGNTYDLRWHNGSADDNFENNDSPARAFDISVLSGRGWLSPLYGPACQRDKDWYKFTVGPGIRRVKVDCAFAHEFGNVDLGLYKLVEIEVFLPLPVPILVAVSAGSGDNEQLDHTLTSPGTYFLEVSGDNAGTIYDLSWEALPFRIVRTAYSKDSAGPVFDITFESVPENYYAVEVSTDLEDSDWTRIGTVLAEPVGRRTTYRDEVAVRSAARLFYRVRHLRLPDPVDMAFIPAGSFAMGAISWRADERPVHDVEVSAFYLDRFEVTRGLWDKVAAWGELNGYTDLPAQHTFTPLHPANRVPWYAAVKWCNARSEMEGLTPVYYVDEARTTVYRTGENDLGGARVYWFANGYRLPTEAEWEKAARGRLIGIDYPWGTSITGADANYQYSGDPWDWSDDHLKRTTPVGYYDGTQGLSAPDRANGYGLYDMAGNVPEWCWDWYEEGWYRRGGATDADTRGPASSPDGSRVTRGGGHADSKEELRCASRHFHKRPDHRHYIGFRCARGL